MPIMGRREMSDISGNEWDIGFPLYTLLKYI